MAIDNLQKCPTPTVPGQYDLSQHTEELAQDLEYIESVIDIHLNNNGTGKIADFLHKLIFPMLDNVASGVRSIPQNVTTQETNTNKTVESLGPVLK